MNSSACSHSNHGLAGSASGEATGVAAGSVSGAAAGAVTGATAGAVTGATAGAVTGAAAGAVAGGIAGVGTTGDLRRVTKAKRQSAGTKPNHDVNLHAIIRGRDVSHAASEIRMSLTLSLSLTISPNLDYIMTSYGLRCCTSNYLSGKDYSMQQLRMPATIFVTAPLPKCNHSGCVYPKSLPISKGALSA